VKLELSKLASGYELLGVLLASFGLNIIPFAGPSNLLIASSAALAVDADPFTLGFLVALGSTSAKFIHYLVTFFLGRFLGGERRRRLDVAGLKIRRWAFLALFVAAASPIPDEPVVVPLGLLRYNPIKFCLAFFLGKLSITIVGAYFGRFGQAALLSVTSQEVLMVISIILTIVVTVVLLKVDVGKIAEKVLKKVKGV
jgi:membrane protein DedA with SNARE-associated domain